MEVGGKGGAEDREGAERRQGTGGGILRRAGVGLRIEGKEIWEDAFRRQKCEPGAQEHQGKRGTWGVFTPKVPHLCVSDQQCCELSAL